MQPNRLPQTVAVRDALREAGISITEAANRLGISRSQMHARLRSGKFDLSHIEGIAAMTGATLTELTARIEAAA